MYHIGFDYFCPEPGQWGYKCCHVCNSLMRVDRNCKSATNFVTNMAKKTRKHDKFTCPNSGQKWHTQAIHIMKAIMDTPSGKLAEILQEELDEILLTKICTKESYAKF